MLGLGSPEINMIGYFNTIAAQKSKGSESIEIDTGYLINFAYGHNID